MLKLIGIFVLIVTVVAVLLAITGRKSVYAEATINASPADVWAMITDPESYASWNPILIKAKGEYVEGGAVTYQMKIGDAEPTEVTPLIKQIKTNEMLHQGGGMTGILTFDHRWQLEAVPGGTKVVQQEEYTGIGVWFWDPSEVEQQYQQGLDAMKVILESSHES